jgi:hypothetical protein
LENQILQKYNKKSIYFREDELQENLLGNKKSKELEKQEKKYRKIKESSRIKFLIYFISTLK